MRRHWFVGLFITAPPEIGDEVVEYYRQHPEELDLIINKEEMRLGFLRNFFLLGLLLTFLARMVAHFFAEELGPFVTNVVLDLVFELGNAVMGGVVAAFFLEYLQTKQYQENLRFRTEIKRRLEASSGAPPDAR